jgi:hypothetical protein
MVTQPPSFPHSQKIHDRKKRKVSTRRKLIIAAASVLGSASAILSASFDKRLKYISKRTGQDWVEELLYGHPERCLNSLRLSQPLVLQLLRELCVLC